MLTRSKISIRTTRSGNKYSKTTLFIDRKKRPCRKTFPSCDDNDKKKSSRSSLSHSSSTSPEKSIKLGSHSVPAKTSRRSSLKNPLCSQAKSKILISQHEPPQSSPPKKVQIEPVVPLERVILPHEIKKEKTDVLNPSVILKRLSFKEKRVKQDLSLKQHSVNRKREVEENAPVGFSNLMNPLLKPLKSGDVSSDHIIRSFRSRTLVWNDFSLKVRRKYRVNWKTPESEVKIYQRNF